MAVKFRSSRGKEVQKSSGKCKAVKTLIVTALILLLLLGAVYGVFYHYYSMMNFDLKGNGETVSDAAVDEDMLTEENTEPPDIEDDDADPNAEDSDEQDISYQERENQENWENSKDETMNIEDVYNLLIVGIDSRTNNNAGRSDAMMIMSVNSETKQITITSIMRDIYLYIPGEGNTRINAAYAYGGADLLIDTIEQNFNIDIDNYVATNFFTFAEAVDACGGVDVELSASEVRAMNDCIRSYNALIGIDKETDVVPAGTEGLLHLNGKQALCYSRIRYVGNADFERTQRQRNVIMKIMNKCKDMNLIELNDLATSILPLLYTDLTQADCLSLLMNMMEYKDYEIQTFRIPEDGTWSGLMIRGMSVLGIDFDKNKKDFFNLVYGENYQN